MPSTPTGALILLNYELLTPTVDRAAAFAAAKFPSHHDINDVKQTLWLWVMENRGTVSRIAADSEGSDTALIDLLVKAANGYLKEEDAAAYGYDKEDQFNFSLDLIKSILEVVFKHEDWQSLSQAIGDGLPRAKSSPATSGNNLASYADVSRAITSLPEDQYNVLVWRYKYQYTFQQIGTGAGITRQGAENRHRAALSALQQHLGKKDLADFRRGAEGRSERFNSASSQAQIERDYEGG